MNEPISNAQMDTVCKIGQGHDCCRYLGFGPNGATCFKDHAGFKALVDDRVAKGTMTARGDNCLGWASVDDTNSPPTDAKPGDTWGAYRLNENGWWVLNPEQPQPKEEK